MKSSIEYLPVILSIILFVMGIIGLIQNNLTMGCVMILIGIVLYFYQPYFYDEKDNKHKGGM